MCGFVYERGETAAAAATAAAGAEHQQQGNQATKESQGERDRNLAFEQSGLSQPRTRKF